MKRTFGALIIVALLVIIAVVVFAKGMIGKSPENSSAQKCPMNSEMMKTSTMPHTMNAMQNTMSGMQNDDSMQINNITAFADTLNLSDEKKNKINGIMTANKTDVIKKKAELDILETDLTKFTNEEKPNLGNIEKQIQKIANLEASIRYSQIKANLDIKSVLSKEQRDNLKNIHKTGDIKMKEHTMGSMKSKGSDCCDTK